MTYLAFVLPMVHLVSVLSREMCHAMRALACFGKVAIILTLIQVLATPGCCRGEAPVTCDRCQVPGGEVRESHVAIVFGSAAWPHAMKPGKWAAQGTFKAVAPLGQQPRASTVVSGNNMVGALGNNMVAATI